MPLILKLYHWRLRTPFYYGWLVLGAASFATIGATGVAQVVLGGIQDLIFEDMGWDRSTVAYAVTAGTWIGGGVSPLVGSLADRYGSRWMMSAASLLTGVCLFAAAGAGGVVQFSIGYIIARGLGNTILISVVPRTLAVNFFQRQRNFAIGLISMARPVAGAGNIQFFALMARAGYSWRVGYRALGVFALVFTLPLLLILRRRPEDIGLLPDGVTAPRASNPRLARASGAVRRASGDSERSWRVGEAARTFPFWAIVVAESFSILTSGALGYQIVPYLLDSGVARPQAALALSISSLLGAFANPAWGLLSDKYSPRKLAMAVLVLALAATVLLLAIELEWLAGLGVSARSHGAIVVVIWGAASGGVGILGSMMLAQYFGRAHYGAILGLVGLFQTASLGAGPSLSAVLYRLTGGRQMALFAFGTFAYTFATLLMYTARRPRAPRGMAQEHSPAA